METTVRDILTFHKMDRALYDRFIRLGRSPDVARNVIALWMWLEHIGIDVIRTIKDYDNDGLVLCFFAEAVFVLAVIRQDAPPPPENRIDIPLTATLVTEPLNLRFFYCNSDPVIRGITYVLDGVGRLIFDDRLVAIFRAYEAATNAADAEGLSTWRGILRRRGAWPVPPPELFMPYDTLVLPSPEDSRSMFITFSKGLPLKREEIFEYFTERWGECVERVMMERTLPGGTPMYGRIVFTSESFIGLVLNGEQLVKFVIKGKQLWARKYVSRNN